MSLRDNLPPEDDPTDLANRLAALLARYPAEKPNVRRLLLEAVAEGHERPLPKPQAIVEIDEDFPATILRAAGLNGAILAENQLCLLAAEGGIGKSPLTTAIAVGMAMIPDHQGDGLTAMHGGILEGVPGSVLMATYEDPPGVTRSRATRLAATIDKQTGGTAAQDSLNKVYVIDMHGLPIYGPPQGATYNSRPEPLRGWHALWDAAAKINPKLIILDPALQSYAGDSNSPAPVREYIGALGTALADNAPGSGMLITAHSTKESRRGTQNPFDPGMVAGSGGWTDATRGLLTMTWAEGTQRVIAIPKCNWGPSRVKMLLSPVTHTDGAVIAFSSSSQWLGESQDFSHEEVPHYGQPVQPGLTPTRTYGDNANNGDRRIES